jgi:hypothetical protein
MLMAACLVFTGCCLTGSNNKIVDNDDFIKTEMYLAAAGQDNVVASNKDWEDFKKNVVAEKFNLEAVMITNTKTDLKFI